MIPDISASLVIFNPDLDILIKTINSLLESIELFKKKYQLKFQIDIIDNSSSVQKNKFKSTLLKYINLINKEDNTIQYHELENNPGFGAANNHSINVKNSNYHIILNPDVYCEQFTILQLYEYLENNLNADIVVPTVFDWDTINSPQKKIQYLIKSYPSVFVLFIRGFAPEFLKKIFRNKISNFECREIYIGEIVQNVQIASGCFMFCRTASLKKVNGFDENFFLYFEDFDLSLRIGRIDFFPDAKLYHRGGNTSKKGWKHITYFITSAYRFFNKHGWKWI